MRDYHLSLDERITQAIQRVTSGDGAMRIPVEATDPDLVLVACRDEIRVLTARVEAVERERDGALTESNNLRLRVERAVEGYKAAEARADAAVGLLRHVAPLLAAAGFGRQHPEDALSRIDALLRAASEGEATDDAVEAMAERIRVAWVAWARTQPNPKPSWLVPWAECDEQTKDADRAIARAVMGYAAPAPGHEGKEG